MASSLLDAIATGQQLRLNDQRMAANEFELSQARRAAELRPLENRLASMALGNMPTQPRGPNAKPMPDSPQGALAELIALNPELGQQVQAAGLKIDNDIQSKMENARKFTGALLQSLRQLPEDQRAAARDRALRNPLTLAAIPPDIAQMLAEEQDWSDAALEQGLASYAALSEQDAPSYELQTTADDRIVAIDKRDPTRVVDTGQRARPQREPQPPPVSYTVQPWVGPDGGVVPVRINNRSGSVEPIDTPEGLRPATKGQGADSDRLRRSFLKETQGYAEMVAAYSRIRSAATDNTGAQDLALIFSFMKMLDPTSVVRESEFAQAVRTGGVPDQIAALYNQVTSGQKLSPQQRQNFVRTATSQLNAARDNAAQIENEYRRIAIDQGVDPDQVIIQREARPGRLPPGVRSITPVRR